MVNDKENKNAKGKQKQAKQSVKNPGVEELLVTGAENARQSLKKRSLLNREEIAEPEFIAAVTNDDLVEKIVHRSEQEKIQKKKDEALKDPISTAGVLSNNYTKAEWEEHFLECMKVINANKVSRKNAFKLQVIDYMKNCLPSKFENLTLMSCTLDASAKVYGYRVDKAYEDMVKAVSGKVFDKDDDESDDENNDNEEDPSKKKKKKKYQDIENLQLDKMLCHDERLLDKTDNQEGESIFKDRTTLPLDYEYFLQCPITDPDCELTINTRIFSYKEDPGTNQALRFGCYKGTSVSVDLFSSLPGYRDILNVFHVIDGSVPVNNPMNESFAFDVDEVPIDEDPRLDEDEGGAACFIDAEPSRDYDDFQSEPRSEQEAQVASEGAPEAPSGPTTINDTVDIPNTSFTIEGMTNLVATKKKDDYTFFDNSKIEFWKQPTHWNLTRPKKQNIPKNHKDTKKVTKKLDAFDFETTDFEPYAKDFVEKFNGILTKKTIKLWNKDKTVDVAGVQYTKRNLLSLFVNEQLMYVDDDFTKVELQTSNKNEDKDEHHDEHQDEAIINLPDRERETDHEYGDEIMDEGDHMDDDDPYLNTQGDNIDVNSPNPSVNIIEDDGLVPAPSQVAATMINYSRMQKRINMKLLKSKMWDSLNLENDPQKKVEFEQVYNETVKKLPPEDAKELSVPLGFLTLLHLANEKNLYIRGSGDISNIRVKKSNPPRPEDFEQ